MPTPSPMVVVAHDGTGDFGPDTPGTKTAGWQEAIDYCVEHARDLYVKGGWGGRTAIYHIADTIRLPATQDFRIDGGVYVLNWVGPADKDLLVVDSGMDCHFTFGILVYGGMGAALRVKPEHPVPIDQFAVFTDSEIRASSIADPRPFERGERKGGAGVVFDTSKAPIVHADFYFTAVLNFATCVEMPDADGAFAYNRVTCMHLHTNADRSTLLKLGSKSKQNTLTLTVGVDQGAAEVRGVDIFGVNNAIELKTRGGFPEGNDLIFEEAAEGNQVNIIHGRDRFIPEDFITDKAETPTNQVTWTGAPPPVRIIEAGAGTFEYTQRLYPATVRLTGGKVTNVRLVRGETGVDYEASAPEAIVLSVGDKLIAESNEPSKLEVIPLKAK
ncbi:MAG: hypothetical protein JSV65_15630 [Armatimonadota bacterium]|nr:MAG: hypothetical protein JSV65_15630 [Armatimonadota bacterium]